MELHITVSGPGQIINLEVMYLQHIFEQLGCRVEVNNEYPSTQMTDEDIISLLKKQKNNIYIKADHCPWGG